MHKKTTYLSFLLAISLMLSFIETLIPLNIMMPGFKLGLSNICVLIALYSMDFKTSFLLMLAKVLLSNLLFSNPYSLLYSLSGGVISLLAALIIKKINIFSIISASMTAAIFHNLSQILVFSIIIKNFKSFYYAPVLILLATFTGLLTGSLALSVLKYLPSHFFVKN